MLDKVTHIEVGELPAVAQRLCFEGYRFVTATCVDNGDESFDLLYHFDRDLQLETYRFTVPKTQEVVSISSVYFCAVFVENEMKELFGVRLVNLLVDYDGRLLLSAGAPSTPMAAESGQITIERRDGEGTCLDR